MEKSNIINKQVPQIQLSYTSAANPTDLPKLTEITDAYNIFIANWDMNKIELVEQFKILLLNRTSRIIGIHELSSGGTCGTVVDIKMLFVSALKANAHSIILSHNHPSGNVNPSQIDMRLTKKIKEAGALLDIPVLDHLIISRYTFYSFANEGLL